MLSPLVGTSWSTAVMILQVLCSQNNLTVLVSILNRSEFCRRCLQLVSTRL